MSKDKKIAKQLPPWDPVEGHDWRFQAKRIQHGSNYGLSPYGIAMIAQIPLEQAKLAYERYMTEFDYIPAWHGWMRQQVREQRPLINPLGREVELVGRPWDDHTWRQGLAFLPQSTLADIEDLAMWRVWHDLELQGLQLLAQVHDAILFQYPRGELSLVREALQRMRIPLPVTDFQGTTRMAVIGVEAAVGRNWGHKGPDNPYGIDEAPVDAYLKEHPLDTH
jgi:DNA polymerase I-like protein with 3'-5' exonuclease and polymerase domains